MSLFGGLYVGTSGLQTSQNALNTTAHNLSNINTTGYVRQQVAEADTHYNKVLTRKGTLNQQAGLGVQYSEVRHVRDYFLDVLYREESGRYSFYETSYSASLEIEDILGELDGAAFKESMEDLWTSFEELSKSPNDPTNISLLVTSCATFIENAASVYDSFVEYQDNLNLQIKDMVDEINIIATQIDALNDEISRIEVGGIENANDLRDARDLLLDTLAGYGNVSYDEYANGRIQVKFCNEILVTDTKAFQIEMLQDKDTGFYTPYWPQLVSWVADEDGNRMPDYEGAEVINTTLEISAQKDTDVGALRALILARGDHIANYTDVESETMTQRKLDALHMTEEEYLKDAQANGTAYFNSHIMNSSIMSVQAQFDHLVHSIATKINGILAEHCQPENGYLCNEDGTPMQLFLKSATPAYEKIASTDYAKAVAEGAKVYAIYENGEPTGMYWKYIEEDPDDLMSMYNCQNMKINQTLVQIPALLGFTKIDDSADYDIGTAFLKQFEAEGIYLNPNVTKATDFENSYVGIVDQFATLGNLYNGLYEFQQLTVEQVESNRQSVIGVSSDDELEHMIMYQNAYNAASRYINVINTLLDSLISMAQ